MLVHLAFWHETHASSELRRGPHPVGTRRSSSVSPGTASALVGRSSHDAEKQVARMDLTWAGRLPARTPSLLRGVPGFFEVRGHRSQVFGKLDKLFAKAIIEGRESLHEGPHAAPFQSVAVDVTEDVPKR